MACQFLINSRRRFLRRLVYAGVLFFCLVGLYKLNYNAILIILPSFLYKTNLTEDEIFNEPLAQDDHRVVNYLRKNFLIPPSKLPYNLVDPKGNTSEKEGQNRLALEILHNMIGGFFVEIGALDGETLSTTLLLEMDYGWNGFLAEPMQRSFDKLVKKNRKAWIANICLSPTSHPQLVNFEEDNFALGTDSISTIQKYHKRGHTSRIIKTACFPVFTILSALNVSTVDFFALDVNGQELDVVKTIPYDEVLIKVFCIACSWVPEGKVELRRVVESKGFKFVREIKKANAEDLLFIHNSLA